MNKLLKSIACFATAALVGASALADGLLAGTGAFVIGGNSCDCTGWSTSGGDNASDLGVLDDLTISGIQFDYWTDGSTGGANVFFELWDGDGNYLGGYPDGDGFWLGNDTVSYIGGDYNHDYRLSWSGSLDGSFGANLTEGETYFLDVKIKTYGNYDFFYPNNDDRTQKYHTKFIYGTPQTFLYDVNDGDTGEASCGVLELTLPVGSTYDGAVQSVWEGHAFRGWWTDPTGGTRYQNGISVVPDNGGEAIQLYAHWAVAQVITLHANGGTCSTESVMRPVGNVYWGLPAAPTRDGYAFLGWYTEADGGDRVRNGDTVTGGAALDLYAHWALQQVIALHANGGTCSKESVTRPVGNVYWGLPAAPTRDGYSFLGWYTEADGGDRVRNGDTVTGGATLDLYAHWAALQVITLHANGGTCSRESVTRPVGNVYWYLPLSPTLDGHAFLGWFADDEEGTPRVKNGDVVTDALTRDLYAHWRETTAASSASLASRSAHAARSATVTDTLDRDFTGVSGTSYSAWSEKTGTSGAVYAGQSAGGNDSIQLRSNNNNSGIVTTTSAGKVKKVTLVWYSGTDDARIVNIYGANTAYTAASQLYSTSTQGTSLGSLKKGDATTVDGKLVSELEIGDDYEFIGLRSSSGALYLSSVQITWELAVTEPTVTVAASATEVYVDEEVTLTATAEGFTDNDNVEWTWYVNNTEVSGATTATLALDTSAAGTYAVTAMGIYGDDEIAESEAVTITVNALATPHDVVIVDDGHGTVVATPASAMVGQTVTLTVSPDDGYRLDTITVDDVVLEGLTFTMPDDDVLVGVTFEGQHEIYVGTDGNGEAVADADYAFSGMTITLTVTPDDGYALDAITVNDGAVEVTGTSFVMPKDDVIVEVTFKEAVEFEQITSIDNLKAGEYVITGAASVGASEYAMLASVNTSGSNPYIERQGTAVDVDGSSVFDPADSIVWTLAQVNGGWTIYNEDVGYVAYLSSGKNAASSETSATDKSTWTIEASGEEDGLFKVGNVGTTGRYLQYNSSSPRFACYTGGQKNLAFYKKKVAVSTQTFLYDVNDGDTGEASCEVLELTLPVDSTYDGAVQAVWAGHWFRGWWTDPTGGTRYQNGISVVPDLGEPLTLYAHWEVAQVITLHANGGTCSTETVTRPVGNVYWGLPAAPTRDGYAFLGWYTEADGGDRVRNGDTVTGGATLDLYAHWALLQVITLHANGGTCSKETVTRPVGNVYWDLPAAPTRDGYAFLGWYTAEDGGDRVRNGDTVTGGATLDLYAHWAALQVITLHANGGTCSRESVTRPVGNVYWYLPLSPTLDGHAFLGWFADDEEGTPRVKNGDVVTDALTRDLYAHWKERVAPLAITGFSMASRTAAPATRSSANATVECTLWVATIATLDYEIRWTDALTGEWTVLKRWTAEADGETPVTVEIPAEANSGFFGVVEIVE